MGESQGSGTDAPAEVPRDSYSRREALRWAGGAAPGGAAPGDAAASGLRAEYVRACSTIGRTVRVELPGGASLSGRAADVDSLGRLLVDGPDGVQPVSAGDVVHVR